VRRWLLLLVCMVALAAVLFGFGMVGGRGHHDKRPLCTSAISSIRVVGNRTLRGPTVWFPKGCRHD
jgi:hypothetical protein